MSKLSITVVELQSDIKSLYREKSRLVYSLYDLTEEEIKIIEGK